jgi:uncharacterized protein (DUF433 family)
MIIAMASILGQGVYPLSEVIQYTGLPATTVRNWFKWRSDKTGKGPIFTSDYKEIGGDYAISFLNLIEVCVAAFLREQGVSPALIRRAYAILREELHTAHPFAHADLRTDGVRIIRHRFTGKDDAALVDVVSKQMLFSQMRDLLSRITYGNESHLAEAWKIAKGITIKPGVSFGKPVIEGTGVTTFVLANQYKANGKDAARVARLFNVKIGDVKNAVHFESHLKQRQAA